VIFYTIFYFVAQKKRKVIYFTKYRRGFLNEVILLFLASPVVLSVIALGPPLSST
jgi:hypothetical protein